MTRRVPQKALHCDPKCLLQRPETSKLPVRRGCKGALVYVDQKRVALVQERVALVQNRVALVQETLGRPFLALAKTPFDACVLNGRGWRHKAVTIPKRKIVHRIFSAT